MPHRRRRRNPYVVLSTVPTEQNAKKIARLLTQGKLAACVSIIPRVHSYFRWHGKVDRAREWLLVIKTDGRSMAKLKRVVLEHHPYQVPELIGWPIAWGNKSYLDWLRESIKGV